MRVPAAGNKLVSTNRHTATVSDTTEAIAACPIRTQQRPLHVVQCSAPQYCQTKQNNVRQDCAAFISCCKTIFKGCQAAMRQQLRLWITDFCLASATCGAHRHLLAEPPLSLRLSSCARSPPTNHSTARAAGGTRMRQENCRIQAGAESMPHARVSQPDIPSVLGQGSGTAGDVAGCVESRQVPSLQTLGKLRTGSC